MIAHARAMRRAPTTSEAILWTALRGKKLDGVKFRRQHLVGPFIVDFCAASHRLIVEIDGSVHANPHRAATDARRDEYLRRTHRILRISAALVEEAPTRALEMIRDELGKSLPGI